MSSNIINFSDFKSPVRLPSEIQSVKSWLVWRLVQMPGDKKPKKIPYYVNGELRQGNQGTEADCEALVSFERAVAAAAKGRYSGVGLAMLRQNGLIALDFDDCVNDQGVIDPRIEDLIQGTYSEYSPSGRGVRAFYLGSIRDRKSHNKNGRYPFAVEFFCGSGYVTITGNLTPMCELWGWGEKVRHMPEAVLALYRERFDDDGSGGDDVDWLATLTPKIGLNIEVARSMVAALDAECGYDEWRECGMALHHEFDGSSAALEIWREWSKRSPEKYPGDTAIDAKWDSFGRYSGQPITAAWLLKHSKTARVVARYEAMGEWKEKIAQAADDYELREKVAPLIAKDDRLGDLERESLAQILMKDLARHGLKVSIVAVRKLIAPPSVTVPTVMQRRPLTEFGNAERMLDRFGASLMYVPQTDAWYVWSGVYWRHTTKVEIEHYAKETVRQLVDEANEHNHSPEFYDWCSVSQQSRMVKNMVHLAASDPRVMVPVEELDKHKHLLGVQNGVVDLRTGDLSKPDPALRITRVCACDYKPNAKAPLFRQTVLDVFSDDAEMADFFQRIMGYAALGDPTEDVMVIAHGNGSNGKSTVLNTVRKAFGTYAKAADASTFVGDGKGSSGGPREDLVRLQGARFVYVTEPDENGELREGSVKAMTGGDSLPARAVFARSTVEIEPTWVVVMPTNHKPVIKGSDYGIWRRLVLIPFLRNFDKDPLIAKDEKREAKLQAEIEGVLAYVVAGARAYLSDGLSPPAGVRNARDQYRSQMDLLAEWLDECCEQGDSYIEQSQRLWLSWEEFARNRGILQYVRSSVALSRRLDQRFPSVRGTGGVRMRSGIRLKQGTGMYSDDFFDDK